MSVRVFECEGEGELGVCVEKLGFCFLPDSSQISRTKNPHSNLFAQDDVSAIPLHSTESQNSSCPSHIGSMLMPWIAARDLLKP